MYVLFTRQLSVLSSVICHLSLQACGFKTGVVTTGNSLDAHDQDRKIMLSNDASVKDMEAASIAWVCEKSQMPFFALKVVTDIVDGDQVSLTYLPKP